VCVRTMKLANTKHVSIEVSRCQACLLRWYSNEGCTRGWLGVPGVTVQDAGTMRAWGAAGCAPTWNGFRMTRALAEHSNESLRVSGCFRTCGTGSARGRLPGR